MKALHIILNKDENYFEEIFIPIQNIASFHIKYGTLLQICLINDRVITLAKKDIKIIEIVDFEKYFAEV